MQVLELQNLNYLQRFKYLAIGNQIKKETFLSVSVD